ncbi:MAG: TolC family protein [candidate division Zixibacteria bacterium]|nr:TolC family protein [candidate division Zixibacteria bacterium]
MTKKILTTISLFIVCFAISGAETVLTVDKVREMALESNRRYLSAKQEIDRSEGNYISARSGAMPEISLSGRYTRNLTTRDLFFAGEKIPISLNNDFSLSLSLAQPLYVGGKVGAALQIAKFYRGYTSEKLEEVKANIIFGAESMFYSAVLAESSRDVLQKAFEQLSYNLDVVEKYYKQGMISEYELLRARVEKSNLEPQLIASQSEVNLSQKRLKSFLGLPLEEEIRLTADMGDTSLTSLPSLDSLLTQALHNRPEVKQADYQKRAYDKAVRIAKGNWLYPTIGVGVNYDLSASSDDFRLSRRNTSQSWSASLMFSIPLFDGGRTIGEVRKARVDYYQAMLTEQQTFDDVRLEVEQAYDNLMTAKKALEMQKETIAQAEEGMRISNLRYQSGIGTQLEVLSAQTALTNARTNLAGATYNFRLAKSALKKAVSYEIN